MKFHGYIRLIEDVTPKVDRDDAPIEVSSEGLAFAVRAPWTKGVRLVSRWSLDGVENPRWRNSDRVILVPRENFVGRHELRVDVRDETGFVRRDPAGVTMESFTWKVDLLEDAPEEEPDVGGEPVVGEKDDKEKVGEEP